MPVLIRVRRIIAVELAGWSILGKRSEPGDGRRSLFRSTVSNYNDEDVSVSIIGEGVVRERRTVIVDKGLDVSGTGRVDLEGGIQLWKLFAVHHGAHVESGFSARIIVRFCGS